jgi:hypothetical protein
VNRWYCSECHRREIIDPETLWNHFMSYYGIGSGDQTRKHLSNGPAAISIAC